MSNLIKSLTEIGNRERLKQIINENGFILRDENFLNELAEIKSKDLPISELLTEVFLLYRRAILENHYLDKEISLAVKTIATRISKQYCLNGKCLAKPKYACCVGCINQTPKGCLDKPNICLNFFCLEVIHKLPKRIKKVLGLHKCEGDFKELDKSNDKNLKNKLSDLISSLLFNQ